MCFTRWGLLGPLCLGTLGCSIRIGIEIQMYIYGYGIGIEVYIYIHVCMHVCISICIYICMDMDVDIDMSYKPLELRDGEPRQPNKTYKVLEGAY